MLGTKIKNDSLDSKIKMDYDTENIFKLFFKSIMW